MKAKYLKIDVGPRYLEDSDICINGVCSEDISWEEQKQGVSSKMPFMVKEKLNIYRWKITINLLTGTVIDWPDNVDAYIHYKVCDDGSYCVLDENMNEINSFNNYVPQILAYADREYYGCGDYIIMSIDREGKIAMWPKDKELDKFIDKLVNNPGF